MINANEEAIYLHLYKLEDAVEATQQMSVTHLHCYPFSS